MMEVEDRRVVVENAALYEPVVGSSVRAPVLAPEVSIIIPAKNEGRNLQRIVEKTLKLAFNQPTPFEILLVDDGSWDDTLTISRELAANDPRVVVVENHSNYGKGFSLRRGFGMARGDFIVTMDGDGQHLPEEIPKLLGPILDGEADFVLGSRFLDNNNGVPLRHWIGNWMVSLCFNLIYRSHFTDVLLGLRAFRRDVIDGMRLDFNGYLVEVEMLANVMRENVKIVEVPTRCEYLKKSSLFRGIGIIWKIVAGLFYMRFARRQNTHALS